MGSGSTIKSISARQIFSNRGHPGVECTVVTESGARGTAQVTAGVSVGKYEVKFLYDGGERWRGRGVNAAVASITEKIAPKVIGMDATKQQEIDQVIIDLDGTEDKHNLGGNATASVSAAALKAGAAALDIPLYQHIGGANACTLPVPGVISLVGSTRYGSGARSGGKPSHSLYCFGFNTFSEASYAAYTVQQIYADLLKTKFGLDQRFGAFVPPGLVKHDKELWDLHVEAIKKAGYEGKIGIQVDVAAGTFYNAEKKVYEGIFSAEDKTQDDLFKLYRQMCDNYPFVIIEDPLDEDDYAGHAVLTKELGVQIVGDDLFTTNTARVQHGIDIGAANCVLLKVNQIGTISEAFDMVRLAYRNGYAVMPCDSRGEGEAIADYVVGLNTGQLREGGIGPVANRFLEIEAELGNRAQFLGIKALKVTRSDR